MWHRLVPMNEFHFFSYDPAPDLAPFVEAIWGVRGAGGHHTEAIVPNGAIELMINFGPLQEVIGHGDRVLDQTYRHAWVAGIQDRRLVHRSASGSDHIAVRFRPAGAHAFLPLRMDEIANQVIDLDLLLGNEAMALRDRLGEARSDRDRAGLLEGWLRRQLRVDPSFDTVREAAARLRPGERPPSVAALCEDLGLSNKHLVELFRRTVGLPPKVLGRVHRLQSAIASCRGRSRVDWIELAHACGYADQSHLIREFRSMAGTTPSRFLRSRTPDQLHVIVDQAAPPWHEA